MSQIVPLLASATLALVYLLFLTDAAPSTLRSVVKTGAVALLAISALPVPLLALALGLSALGDLALSRDGDRAFLAGVAAFALAHTVQSLLPQGYSEKVQREKRISTS